MSETSWQSTFRWEQDRAGGKHGAATFIFPLTNREVSLRIETFREAMNLQLAIGAELAEKRHDARAGLLAEIARIGA